jgi:hypothetical protein
VARFAWILNLDAELELREGSRRGYNPSTRVTAQLAEYGRGSRALLGPDDVLVEPGVDAHGLVGRAWCPTPNAVSRLVAAGAEPEPHPDVGVLRRVNHRRFAVELGGGLPEQRYVEDRAELERRFERVDRPWLLKRPLAFAGRGQMRVYRPLDAIQWKWVDATLRNDGLVLEPLVTPLREFCLHGFVPRDRGGQIELGQVCVQEVTDRGVFRGVRRATHQADIETDERRALVQVTERVGDALRAAEYFGPFGIDAYRYEADGRAGFCALSEINARYTMGFVTGFVRHPSAIVV